MLETEIKPWETPEGIAREDAVIARAEAAFNTPEATEARIRKALEEFDRLPFAARARIRDNITQRTAPPSDAREIARADKLVQRAVAFLRLPAGRHAEILASVREILGDLEGQVDDLLDAFANPLAPGARERAGNAANKIAEAVHLTDACDRCVGYLWHMEDGYAVTTWGRRKAPTCPGAGPVEGCGSPVAKGARLCVRCAEYDTKAETTTDAKVTP